MSSNLGHLGSKARSQGQIKEIPCRRPRGHIFCSTDLKIGQNVCLGEIWNGFELGHLGSKTSFLGQIKEISCGCCRGHISCSVDLKIGQDICLDEMFDQFEFGLPGVVN